jgi:hypothetical protein
VSAARSAYFQRQPELAVRLYREALDHARERDDQTAIAEISHDLALAELQKGDAGAPWRPPAPRSRRWNGAESHGPRRCGSSRPLPFTVSGKRRRPLPQRKR